MDANHCDMSIVLGELQYLRAEVRALNKVTEEVAVLRKKVLQLQQLKSEVISLRSDIDKLNHFPPLSTTERPRH